MQFSQTNSLAIAYDSASDQGLVRANNEDSLVVEPRLGLFGVCDGMGGHAAGEVASGLASQTMSSISIAGAPGEELSRVISKANSCVYSEQLRRSEFSGMGTTLSVVWLRNGKRPTAWMGHVGDSRIYRMRDGVLKQLSDDHSPVFKLYQDGVLSKDELRRHPQRNLVQRSIGIERTVQPDIFSVTLAQEDLFLICSDGLSDLLSDDEISTILKERPPEERVRTLVERANQNGGKDNVSVVVVEIRETREPASPK